MKRLEAVIFDWAGTMVDHGSLAPVRAVTQVFLRNGIRLRDDDVRRDMGIFKKDHIRRILQIPEVNIQWSQNRGRRPGDDDVEKLFAEFLPLQTEILAKYSQLIPGAAEIAENVRRAGLQVGSTTGYTRPMLDLLVEQAASRGYRPDLSLCPDDAGGGRPHPWMCLQIALRFRLTSTAAAVKVGDTVSDIHEGLNAGMWCVGVTATGNEIGLTADELAALPQGERTRRSARAEESLRAAGAHYVIESVQHLLPVLEEVDRRAASGGRP
jgi:phosphonoacetaldehyde hydrolase